MNAVTVVNPQPVFGMNDVRQIAFAIAEGGLFGSRDPNAVLTLCLLAQAEGQHPAVVFRDYHIIQGKPAKKADAMLRDFINAGGKVEWHTLDDECADATFTHPSGSARIDWTLARAKKAKISNPMWEKYPRQMLRSRVISEGVRTVFPGATSGLYEVGEVQDIDGGEIQNTPRDGGEASGLEGAGEQEIAHSPPKRGLDGPYTSKKALRAAFEKLQSDVHRCGDEDTLEALLATDDAKVIIKQCERDAKHYLEGGEPAPPEFVGLYDLIKQKRDEFAIETVEAEPAE